MWLVDTGSLLSIGQNSTPVDISFQLCYNHSVNLNITFSVSLKMFARALPKSFSHGAIVYALIFALIAVMSFVSGCSSSTAPTTKTAGAPKLNIIGGDQQSDTVVRQLPAPLAVQVVSTVSGLRMNITGANVTAPRYTGTPIPNLIVNFQVQEDGCGKPFAGSQITDTNGNAKELWILGTKAGSCTMKAVAVDRTTGAPLTFDTFSAQALPDTVVDFKWTTGLLHVKAGDTVNVAALITRVTDGYGNVYSTLPAISWSFSSNGPWQSGPCVIPTDVPAVLYAKVGTVVGGVMLTWL